MSEESVDFGATHIIVAGKGVVARRLLSSTSTVLFAMDLLFFALWFGGLVTIGAIVAPVAFNAVRHASGLVGAVQAQTALAGSVIGGSLRMFNVAAVLCGLWLTLRSWTLGSTNAPLLKMRMVLRMALILPAALALLISVVQAFALFPAMDDAQALSRTAAFDRLHHAYELLAQAQLALLFVLALCYGRLLSRKMLS